MSNLTSDDGKAIISVLFSDVLASPKMNYNRKAEPEQHKYKTCEYAKFSNINYDGG